MLDDGSLVTDIRAMDYNSIITFEEGKRSGQPCIRGTRITVSDILEYLSSGMTAKEILDDFPGLTRDDIVAALLFAAAFLKENARQRSRSPSSRNKKIAAGL